MKKDVPMRRFSHVTRERLISCTVDLDQVVLVKLSTNKRSPSQKTNKNEEKPKQHSDTLKPELNAQKGELLYKKKVHSTRLGVEVGGVRHVVRDGRSRHSIASPRSAVLTTGIGGWAVETEEEFPAFFFVKTRFFFIWRWRRKTHVFSWAGRPATTENGGGSWEESSCQSTTCSSNLASAATAGRPRLPLPPHGRYSYLNLALVGGLVPVLVR
jgi:hypothetical protein